MRVINGDPVPYDRLLEFMRLQRLYDLAQQLDSNQVRANVPLFLDEPFPADQIDNYFTYDRVMEMDDSAYPDKPERFYSNLPQGPYKNPAGLDEDQKRRADLYNRFMFNAESGSYGNEDIYREMADILYNIPYMPPGIEIQRGKEGAFRNVKINRPVRHMYPIEKKGLPEYEPDMELKPLFQIKKQGREPELIMKPNPQMRTGQEPNYYRVWDDNRRQWSTRPVEPEELDYYRQQNRRQ